MAVIEGTSLFKEFKKIIDKGSVGTQYRWECEFITEVGGQTAFKVLSVDFARDYDRVYADDIQLAVMLPKGKLTHGLIPFKDNLLVTLKRFPHDLITGEPLVAESIETYRLRAVFVDQLNPVVENASAVLDDEETADISDLIEVKFQLLEPAVEQLRLASVGGIYRNINPGELVKGLLTRAIGNLSLSKDNAVTGIDMVPPSNENVRDHVIIPHGIKLVDLPKYVQENCGGIYGSGIRHYLQRDKWYVYPPFDLTRFNAQAKTLAIINCPPRTFDGVELTYASNGNKLIVLATGKTTFNDDSDILQQNYGNGVRFANAANVVDGFHSVSNNRATVDVSQNTAEFVSKHRKTKKNAVFFSEDRITTNSFKETSKLARRMGSHLMVTWENSDPELIYPGMPVRYLYVEKGDVKEVYGLVIRAHTNSALAGRSAGAINHKTVTHLTLFIENK